MDIYDQAKVEKETAEARHMFVREFPKMFGYVAIFYGLMGAGIPWRLNATKYIIWSSAKASILFGLSSAAILLVVGAVPMSIYLLRKAPYVDFGPGASLTMVWSFRLFRVVGLPLAFWDIFRVVLPATGSIGADFVRNWWMLVLLVGGIAGWFAGQSIGGLVALLSIWLSGRNILRRL